MNRTSKVFHVCNERAAKGSRIFAQRKMLEAEFIVENGVLPSATLIRSILKGCGDSYIFHQQVKLPSLLLSWALNRVLRRDHILVYDMHDLAEKSPRMRVGGLLYLRISLIMEWLVARLGISVITVSKGLADIYCERTGRETCIYIVYNIPQENKVVKVKDGRSNKLVYFGQINSDRVDLKLFRSLVSKGYSIDLYGYFSSGEPLFQKELLAIIRQGEGQYHGIYYPDHSEFLEGYFGCLLVYESNLNNIKYCLPNKLFQALDYGLVCIVSSSLIEATELFGSTNFVIKFDEMNKLCDSHLNVDCLNIKLAKMKEISRNNFISALSRTS